jgi:hypothetical protein
MKDISSRKNKIIDEHIEFKGIIPIDLTDNPARFYYLRVIANKKIINTKVVLKMNKQFESINGHKIS